MCCSFVVTMRFEKDLHNLGTAVRTAMTKKVDMENAETARIDDFAGKQQEYFRTSVINARVTLDTSSKELDQLVAYDENNRAIVAQLQGLVAELKSINDLLVLNAKIDTIATMYLKLARPEEIGLDVPIIPEDIRDDVVADLKELELCFSAGCYRSAVMLCGRLLEVALHRKYYEITGKDILEKNPGIGLGTLIARLNDQNVRFDPGLANQIHLINQVRISSVHKKKEAFYPTQTQTKAVMLYTMDILQKIFGKD